jgi:hypothetical protein
MNKYIFTFIAIISLSISFQVNATTASVSSAQQGRSVLDALIPSRKNCQYVTTSIDKGKKYQPFSDITNTFPGLEDMFVAGRDGKESCVNVEGGTETILKTLFTVAISLIIVFTVISIAVSGIQFMTENATGQVSGGAKKRLTNSFIALGLALLSYTILYTINKQLVNFTFNPAQIDLDKSVDKLAERAANDRSTFFTAVEVIQPSVPNSYLPLGQQPSLVDAFGNITQTTPGAYGAFGTWREIDAENWVRSLPNGVRSTDGRLVVTVYSATKDSITDTNTAQKRGNASNLLREGSVALSPDLISLYRPQTGQEVFINNISIGFYEDATAAVYNGVVFRNTVDIYDENGSIGGSYLKNIPPGQWTIKFGNKRTQIANP